MVILQMIETIIELATNVGMVLRDIYESGKYKTYIKSDNSPVTTADQRANEIILRGLRSHFPKIPAISEESEIIVSEPEKFFIIDPMDGTKGFLNRTDNFTVNIALIDKGKPTLGVIYSPIGGDLFYTSIKRESYKRNFLKKSNPIKLMKNTVEEIKFP